MKRKKLERMLQKGGYEVLREFTIFDNCKCSFNTRVPVRTCIKTSEIAFVCECKDKEGTLPAQHTTYTLHPDLPSVGLNPFGDHCEVFLPCIQTVDWTD